MCKHVWTNEYPTKTGWYWFYGRKYGSDIHTLGTVKVFPVRTSSGEPGVCRVLDGNFMFEGDKHEGMFCPIDKPIISAEIAGGDFTSSPVVITREESI